MFWWMIRVTTLLEVDTEEISECVCVGERLQEERGETRECVCVDERLQGQTLETRI